MEWRVLRTKQGKHRLSEARGVRLEWTKAYNCGGDWAHRVENQVQELLAMGSSTEPRILKHLAHYEFRTTLEGVTGARLQDEIKCRAGSLMNDHVPDVAKRLDDNLKIDMKVVGIGARIAKYFMDFDRIVD
ncbi:hypothetical protein PPTG_03377 [Phytophthora nicotianae INRA-310]|uniref:Uncharacterized protein n=1 Tax=Phytophthora nicotianae (strain INRA-310) TaxID=761204 RepID=W2R4M8_PHYN3|nr:hypothetical protein PPTG_03377 [Phytophthora nicotianae INRA-310]ETN20352.1 hypothetical protein PPTG_03377 [Phytophthora nicotianae INRA-310]